MKIGDKVKYDGEKHLIVNIVDGYPVVVPMSVIDDECFIIDIEDEYEEDVDNFRSDTYFVSNEEADEDYRLSLLQDEKRYR